MSIPDVSKPTNMVENDGLVLEIVNPMDISNSFVLFPFHKNRIIPANLPYTIPRDPRKWIVTYSDGYQESILKEKYGCALVYENVEHIPKLFKYVTGYEMDNRRYIWASPDSEYELFTEKKDGLMFIRDKLNIPLQEHKSDGYKAREEIAAILYTWLCQYKNLQEKSKDSDVAFVHVHDLGIHFDGVTGDTMQVSTILICEVVHALAAYHDSAKDKLNAVAKFDPNGQDFSFGFHTYLSLCRAVLSMAERAEEYDLYMPEFPLEELVYDKRYGRIMCINPHRFCSVYVCGRDMGLREPEKLREEQLAKAKANLIKLSELWKSTVSSFYKNRVGDKTDSFSKLDQEVYELALKTLDDVVSLANEKIKTIAILLGRLDAIIELYLDNLALLPRESLVELYRSWKELSFYGSEHVESAQTLQKPMLISDTCKRILLDKISAGYSNYNTYPADTLPDVLALDDAVDALIDIIQRENTPLREAKLERIANQYEDLQIFSYESVREVLSGFKVSHLLSSRNGEDNYFAANYDKHSVDTLGLPAYIFKKRELVYNVDKLFEGTLIEKPKDPKILTKYITFLAVRKIVEHIQTLRKLHTELPATRHMYIPKFYGGFFSRPGFNIDGERVKIEVLFAEEYVPSVDLNSEDGSLDNLFAEDYLLHEPFHGVYIPLAILWVIVEIFDELLSRDIIIGDYSPGLLAYDKLRGRFFIKDQHKFITKQIFAVNTQEEWNQTIENEITLFPDFLAKTLNNMITVSHNFLKNKSRESGVELEYKHKHPWVAALFDDILRISTEYKKGYMDSVELIDALSASLDDARGEFMAVLDSLPMAEFARVVTDMLRPNSFSLRVPPA